MNETREYKIAILMATYNGNKFLHQQLESIENQTYKNWCLYVLDDGSTDNTWEILQAYQQRLGTERMKIFKQTNQGSTKTFLTLVCNPEIQADYFAYSDQDDIWDLNKLERALMVLKDQDDSKPQLYCANARLINEKNEPLGFLPLKKRKLSFSHALVQCCATGNTMVFNQLGREVIQMIGPIYLPGVHDWWTYLAISAVGGFLYYDPVPTFSYRLHDSNVIGFITNYFQRYRRSLRRVLKNDFSTINTDHIKRLNIIYDYITPENKKILSYFVKAREGNVFKRLYYLYKAKVYRQEITGTVAVYVTQIIGKF